MRSGCEMEFLSYEYITLVQLESELVLKVDFLFSSFISLWMTSFFHSEYLIARCFVNI